MLNIGIIWRNPSLELEMIVSSSHKDIKRLLAPYIFLSKAIFTLNLLSENGNMLPRLMIGICKLANGTELEQIFFAWKHDVICGRRYNKLLENHTLFFLHHLLASFWCRSKHIFLFEWESRERSFFVWKVRNGLWCTQRST